MKCTLCGEKTKEFIIWRNKEYRKCQLCDSIMLNKKYYLNPKMEKERYDKHENDVNDKGYQNFVYPIIEEICKDYNISDKGLDFGSGSGPVVTKLLRERGYDIDMYDPFFADDKRKLSEKYDYIVCCEVMEHFYNPMLEFKRLSSMIYPSGSLYLKTKIYDEEIDFKSWSYKNDSTHVFFYSRKALKYIKNEFNFTSMEIKKNIIIYKK